VIFCRFVLIFAEMCADFAKMTRDYYSVCAKSLQILARIVCDYDGPELVMNVLPVSQRR
jgi:hypothetical protein